MNNHPVEKPPWWDDEEERRIHFEVQYRYGLMKVASPSPPPRPTPQTRRYSHEKLLESPVSAMQKDRMRCGPELHIGAL